MTTRRGFIQGVLVAIGAAVLPKVAEVEAETITVPHRKAPLIDNMAGPTIDMDVLNASARNAAGAITELAETFDSGFVSLSNFSKVCVYYNGGCAEYRLDVTDYSNVKWLLVRDWPDEDIQPI